MIRAVADSHAMLWYIFTDPRLSHTARRTIENAMASGDQIAISSITLAEIIYLSEKGRVHSDTFTRLLLALENPDPLFVEVPFDRHIAEAMRKVERNEIPDLPDRIIAATGLHLGVPVITADRKIRLSGVSTIW